MLWGKVDIVDTDNFLKKFVHEKEENNELEDGGTLGPEIYF